jgi:hypothetical protein
VQHADVKLLTILERVDPKPSGVEQLPALAQRHCHTRDGAERSGHDHGVPMPTVAIVDSAGVIRWIDVHPNYTTRTEVADVVDALSVLD